MKLTTIPNITFNQWTEQATRFAKLSDTAKLTFPKKDVNNMPAIIEMEILQNLKKGFKGRIKYIQQFEELITSFPVDKDGNEDTENPITNPVLRRHVVVDYFEQIPLETIGVMMDAVIVLVPEGVTGYFKIQEWCIKCLFLEQVVNKLTFRLSKNDWI
jgi:hypothetical protein